MRVDFVKAVHAVMARDAKTCFVTGDLGFNALEGIAGDFPARFLNVGVAEQNMIAVAAGLAIAGFEPWVYSIAPFAAFRPFEQIRNDVCHHDLKVRIVGNGGGFTYGIMGATHHALEDVSVLKALPNMHLFLPCANNHVAAAVERMAQVAGPAYLRLGISGFANNDPPLAEDPTTLTRTYARRADSAPGVTLVGFGQAAQIVAAALPLLGGDRARVDAFGVARYPFDPRADAELARSLAANGRAVLVEEHYARGGLAESFAAELGHLGFRWTTLAVTHRPAAGYGSPKWHETQNGLTPDAVCAAARDALNRS